MEGFFVMVALVGAYILYRMYKREREEDEVVGTMTPSYTATPDDVKIADETRDLVIETLKEMGCDYEEVNELRIDFVYQGERFLVEAKNDCYFINVYDLWWYDLSTCCEVEEFAAMQKAINEVNANASCTVLYTVNQETERIGVHTRKNVLFIRQIPDLKGYLTSVLDDFFKVQRAVLTEIEKCKVREEQK